MKNNMKNKTEDNIQKWDIRFLKLARLVSTWSKDPSTKCGAVITKNKRVISLGFNGFPWSVKDSPSFYSDREEKYKRVIHAETNAILFAKRDLTGCNIHIYPMPPCARCTSLIIQSGIEKIVTILPSKDKLERWEADFEISEDMISESDIQIVHFPLFFN